MDDIVDNQIDDIKNVSEVMNSLLTENQSMKEFMDNIFKEFSNLNALVSTQGKQLKSKIDNQADIISNLKDICATYSNENDLLKSQVQSHTKKIDSLQNKNAKQSKEIEDLKRDFNLKVDELEKETIGVFNKIVKLDNETYNFESRLNLLELKIFSPIGVFIWKVDHFSERRKQNGVDYSEFFYSHRDGYKMWLCLFSGGTLKFRGTHLSVQFQVLKGENDDKLAWPFNNNLNLGIIVKKIPFQVFGFKQKCSIDKNGLSPLFNFSFEHLLKHKAIINDSIIFIYSFEEFRTADLLVL